MINALGTRDDGTLYSSFVLTRMTSPIAILVETAYMINPDDYEKLTDEEINNLSLGIFDIINIPHKSFDNIIPNYVCSFFYSSKSKTGYCAIFINKDRETYHNLKHITRKDF